jgi:ABC-2 type transport system permease protein
MNYRYHAAIKKESQVLLRDKVGLMFMFFLPIVFVFLVSIIQNSAYQLADKNSVSLIISNQDIGPYGDSLVNALHESNMYNISYDSANNLTDLRDKTLNQKKLAALYIPENFSEDLINKSKHATNLMMSKIGLDSEELVNDTNSINISLIYDPLLQNGYLGSIKGNLIKSISIIENSVLISEIFTQIGIDEGASELTKQLLNSRVKIKIQSVEGKRSDENFKPNTTQHNIPAWTLFAIFFMVVSLSNNIVREKNNGSFIRLRTMPANITTILLGKMTVFTFAAFLQIFVIFSIGYFIFPFIELPQLNLDFNIFAFILTVFITSIAAVSWALLIGTFSKTQEQSSGTGSISIIIFAALGGIWVPTFIMPEYMQIISKISPMNWGLEAFYALMLKQNSFERLLPYLSALVIFIVLIQSITILKLRKDRLI